MFVLKEYTNISKLLPTPGMWPSADSLKNILTAEQSINMLRVMMCSTAHSFCEQTPVIGCFYSGIRPNSSFVAFLDVFDHFQRDKGQKPCGEYCVKERGEKCTSKTTKMVQSCTSFNTQKQTLSKTAAPTSKKIRLSKKSTCYTLKLETLVWDYAVCRLAKVFFNVTREGSDIKDSVNFS